MRNLMKSWVGIIGGLLLLVGVGFSVVMSPDTNAYLTENCFAIQYSYQNTTVVPKIGVTTPQSEVIYSTDKICINEDGATVRKGKKLPAGTSPLTSPKLLVNSGDKSITVKYCENGSNMKSCEKAQVINFDSSRGISGLADDTYAFVQTIGASPGFELQPVGTNAQGRDRDEVVDDEEKEKEDSEVEKNCSNAGGAESLGWIVCPILTWVGEASNGLYEDAVKPSLQVKPQLFTGGDSNVLNGWQTFQTFANIIFAILLLIVILSQLTGVGIDNYGIKKILPKLIVTAVLINLSYFLCLLFVDISNILGNSLQGLFDQLGSNLDPKMVVDGADGELGSTGKQVLSTGVSIAALGVAGLLVGMSGAVWETPAIALSLLIGIIGIGVSILFLFILLAARQAAIVVLIVLAPIAIVCYALPNTKKFFDKWLKFFVDLLVLYPVCGVLVGGGNYVSALILSTGSGFFLSLTAMIAGIIPIFFIPSLVRGSLAAAGNLGAKISSFGDRMRGRVDRGARNSELYQGLQDRAQKYATRRKYETGRNAGGFRRLLRGGQYGINRNRNQYFKDEMESVDQRMFGDDQIFEQRVDAAKSSAMSKGFAERFGNMSKAELEREAASAATWMGDTGGSERMSELIKAMEPQGMENSIYSMLEENEGIGKMSGVMQTLAGSKNKALKAYGKRGEGEGFASFMGNGGMKAYADAKGADILDGMDDKALGIINKYSNNQNQILSSSVLSEGQAKLNSKEAVDIMDQMMDGRSDFSPSGEQLAQYNSSSIQKLAARAGQDAQMKNNLSQAVSAIAADPRLSAKLSSSDKELLEHATGITIGGGAGVGASGNSSARSGAAVEGESFGIRQPAAGVVSNPEPSRPPAAPVQPSSGIITNPNEAEAQFREMRQNGEANLGK